MRPASRLIDPISPTSPRCARPTSRRTAALPCACGACRAAFLIPGGRQQGARTGAKFPVGEIMTPLSPVGKPGTSGGMWGARRFYLGWGLLVLLLLPAV